MVAEHDEHDGSAELRPYPERDMAGRPPSRQAPAFGARLAELRHARGLTQEQLAERMGATQKTIDYYERRAANPSLDVITRCAEALGVSRAELTCMQISVVDRSA